MKARQYSTTKVVIVIALFVFAQLAIGILSGYIWSA